MSAEGDNFWSPSGSVLARDWTALPFIVNSTAVKPTIKARCLPNRLQQLTQRAILLSRHIVHTLHTVRQEMHCTVLSSARVMGTQPDVDRDNYISMERKQSVDLWSYQTNIVVSLNNNDTGGFSNSIMRLV